jgi:hypothetical protein
MPPLNVKDVVTPWTGKVNTARAVMAAEARAWVDGKHLKSAELVDTPEVRGLSAHAPVVVDLVLPEQAGQPRALRLPD